jgi:hypothetical protein
MDEGSGHSMFRIRLLASFKDRSNARQRLILRPDRSAGRGYWSRIAEPILCFAFGCRMAGHPVDTEMIDESRID